MSEREKIIEFIAKNAIKLAGEPCDSFEEMQRRDLMVGVLADLAAALAAGEHDQ